MGSDQNRNDVWRKSYLPEAAKIAFGQTEKRLADLIEIRKGSETKITSLFSAYIAITLAIFSVSATLAQKQEWQVGAISFFVAAMPFLGGAIVFGAGLMPSRGAILGQEPVFWLNEQSEVDPEAQDSDVQVAKLYALGAHDLATSVIPQQIASNASRQRLLRIGLVLGLIGATGLGGAVWAIFIQRGLGV